MNIAVVGCGALGSYYGAKLCRAGHEVHFLLRSDYDVVRHHGVYIKSVDGDFIVHPRCAKRPEEIGPVDLVVIGLKTTANAEFQSLLSPLVGPNTAIVTLQNGLGNEEKIATLFGSEKTLGGLCFVCLNRIAPGVVQHLGQGMVVMGEFQGSAQPRTREIAELLRHSGVLCKVTDNLAQAHWEKLVWNIPFNGLGVASAAGYDAMISGKVDRAQIGPCLATDALLSDPRWEGLVRDLMMETVAIANALGYPIATAFAEKQLAKTRDMGCYRASTLIDYERGQRLELESLFLEPKRQADMAGVPVPSLTTLCAVLSQLDPGQTKQRD